MAIDVGCGRGHFAKQLDSEDASDLIGSLYQCDIAEKALVNYLTSIMLIQGFPEAYKILQPL